MFLRALYAKFKKEVDTKYKKEKPVLVVEQTKKTMYVVEEDVTEVVLAPIGVQSC